MSDKEFTRREFFSRLRGIIESDDEEDTSQTCDGHPRCDAAVELVNPESADSGDSESVTTGDSESVAYSKDKSLLAGFPHFEGAELLTEPVDFFWPGVDALRQMSTTAVKWEQYSCPKSYSEVAAFFKEQAGNPPYGKQENNWVESEEGIMGVYFDADSELRLVRLWFLPRPDETQVSYLVVMRFNGMLRGNFPSSFGSRS